MFIAILAITLISGTLFVGCPENEQLPIHYWVSSLGFQEINPNVGTSFDTGNTIVRPSEGHALIVIGLTIYNRHSSNTLVGVSQFSLVHQSGRQYSAPYVLSRQPNGSFRQLNTANFFDRRSTQIFLYFEVYGNAQFVLQNISDYSLVLVLGNLIGPPPTISINLGDWI